MIGMGIPCRDSYFQLVNNCLVSTVKYNTVRNNPNRLKYDRRGRKQLARHYSARDFFRRMPNGLLARNFQAEGVFGDLDFASVKDGKPDELTSFISDTVL